VRLHTHSGNHKTVNCAVIFFAIELCYWLSHG
jgi:hypothetical protein